MMNSNNNFLLKIHMEEKDNIKDIFLNKERRSFTFINDECVYDLIIPKFRIANLNMILKNVNESQGTDNYYAEYENENEITREYDKEKIGILMDMITKVNINDFLEHLDEIKVINYYVDNIIDAYNCVLPTEMKQLLSYTTNGVVFGGKENIYMLSHDNIVNYNREIKDFIPLMIKNETNYVGFDYKEALYKEYVNNEKINEAKTLKELIITSQIEVLDLEELEIEIIDNDSDDFAQESREKLDEGLKEEKSDVDYENTIKNIDYQLERLTVGLIPTNKKEEYQYIEKKNEEKIKIKNEILESIRESIKEIEKKEKEVEVNNEIVENIENPIIEFEENQEKTDSEKIVVKKNNIKDKNQPEKQEKKKNVVKVSKIKEIKNDVPEKLTVLLDDYSENKKELSEINEDSTNTLDEQAFVEEIIQNLDYEFISKIEQEEVNSEEEEALSLNKLILKSIQYGNNNYKINFNDTQKLVVEHLPYYEISNDFNVILIPEIEVDKITLLPDSKLDLGRIKLVVDKLSNNKVDLIIQSASNIVDIDNNKIKVGSHITLDLNSEITLRLNKQGVMETWTLKMEKSTFEKELRNIDYIKVMNYISKLQSYRKLGKIEKYELQKSVMLFIDFVMRYNETQELEELYRILENEPTLYEEFITKYNIKHALELKDCLSTYEDKKEFVAKLNYVDGLIDAKWLDYPRYIFKTHNYFHKDEFLQDFLDNLNIYLKEEDFANYLKKLFKEYEMFKDLDEIGKENLDKCLEYLSVLYKHNLYLGEKYKYEIEKAFMIGGAEEDMSLLISKLCRRGIKDYSQFVEYDVMMKYKYRLGELKYPIFSESFGLEDIRSGGEYDEY